MFKDYSPDLSRGYLKKKKRNNIYRKEEKRYVTLNLYYNGFMF